MQQDSNALCCTEEFSLKKLHIGRDSISVILNMCTGELARAGRGERTGNGALGGEGPFCDTQILCISLVAVT